MNDWEEPAHAVIQYGYVLNLHESIVGNSILITVLGTSNENMNFLYQKFYKFVAVLDIHK